MRLFVAGTLVSSAIGAQIPRSLGNDFMSVKEDHARDHCSIIIQNYEDCIGLSILYNTDIVIVIDWYHKRELYWYFIRIKNLHFSNVRLRSWL